MGRSLVPCQNALNPNRTRAQQGPANGYSAHTGTARNFPGNHQTSMDKPTLPRWYSFFAATSPPLARISFPRPGQRATCIALPPVCDCVTQHALGRPSPASLKSQPVRPGAPRPHRGLHPAGRQPTRYSPPPREARTSLVPPLIVFRTW